MYHPTEIAQLSNAQISKLLKGHGVRVKSGKGHVVNLSSEQLKKHQRATMKGAGHTLILDPFQVQQHGRLMGSGVGSKIKKGVKHVGQFVKKNKEHFRPLANELKSMAKKEIEHASSRAIEEGLNPELAAYYSELASEKLNRPHGAGLAKKFSKFVNKPAVRDIRRALKPLGQHLFNTAEQMAMDQIDSAPEMMSSMSGMGMKKRGRPKKVSGGRFGGALMPAGY